MTSQRIPAVQRYTVQHNHYPLSYITVSGGYSEWGDWTNCTAKCGGGEQVRSRTCTNPVPEFGGNDCTLIGESLEKRGCNKVPCPGKLQSCFSEQFV